MKINLVAVGKIKEKYFVDAIKEYQKRLSRFCKLSILEVTESASAKNTGEQIADENNRLKLASKGFVIALDSGGEQVSSTELADFFDKRMSSGVSEFTFLIGGSNGIGAELRDSADYVLSFGKLTFPHQLFRVMALEQIYRALSINAGLPYHK